jgi:cyanate permease
VVRRPEDIGLTVERAATPREEPRFSRKEATATPAFWLLLLYTVLVYPVQAGVSLHQAPHLVERGIEPPPTAALIVASFSFMSGMGTLASGLLPRRVPVRFALALVGAMVALGTVLMAGVRSAADGYLAAAVFGAGIGGLLTLLPVAWADYFGRASYGAVRGLALSAQVLAQAVGPIFSGALRDATGDYRRALYCFAAVSALAAITALAARAPNRGRAGERTTPRP